MTRTREGFALLLVVWLAALLGAVGLHWSVRTRQHLAVAANHVARIETTAAAEAGLAATRATLDRRLSLQASAGTPELDPWRTHERLTFRGGVSEESELRWKATVDDLGRYVNLNVADAVQLRRLLTALAIDSGVAARIADATLDWRDADDWPRVQGAEREAYLSGGAARLPPNRPFEAVREWNGVMGVTEEIYRAVSPYLAVEGSGRINIVTAPDPVLLSLPGFGPEAVAVLGPGTAVWSLSALAGTLSAAARGALRPHLPWLESRTTLRTEQLGIDVTGFRPASRYETNIHAVLVRSGQTSTLVGVWEQP